MKRKWREQCSDCEHNEVGLICHTHINPVWFKGKTRYNCHDFKRGSFNLTQKSKTGEKITVMKEIDKLRGKACRRVIKAAGNNDTWNMKRYAAINSYLASLQQKGEKIT